MHHRMGVSHFWVLQKLWELVPGYLPIALIIYLIGANAPSAGSSAVISDCHYNFVYLRGT